MNKTLQVFVQELRITILRKSFFIALFLLPLAGFVITLIIGSSQRGSTPGIIQEIFVPPAENKKMGLVDQSGYIDAIPESYQDDFDWYANTTDAEQALQSGTIGGFYWIDASYIESGKITLVNPDFNPMGDNDSGLVEAMLNEQILKDDPLIQERIINPINMEITVLAPETDRDQDSGLTFFLPYIVTFLFYIVIMSSASLMLNSVTNEKTNRVMEILMTSVTPMQMLTGKILALGLTGLLQTIVWSGAGLLLLRLSGRTMNVPDSFQLPASILFWGILFFIGGYALYASLMAGVGALVPNLKEASQATFILVIPLIIPMMLISLIANKPNGVLSVVLSMFPLTSPVTMMARLAAGTVPVWQILLSLFLIFAAAYLVIRSVSNFFRAQTLLSGQEFKMKYFFRALAGKHTTS